MKNNNEMTEKEMMNILVELESTKYFRAIQRFNELKNSSIFSILLSIDPFKDPTKMAKAQGNREGIYMLESEIVREKKNRNAIDTGDVIN